jgi:hypothetical protein
MSGTSIAILGKKRRYFGKGEPLGIPEILSHR